MAEKTTIAWTGSTWTPVRARRLGAKKAGWHCERVSPGCRGCYAARQNKWIGTGLDYEPRHRKNLDIFLDEKLLTRPLRWREPRRVFVCSMTDLFADFVRDEWIDRVFAIMAMAERHTFQVLTKRPARMQGYLAATDRIHDIERYMYELGGDEDATTIIRWPLPNVWLGVSVEDQATADERVPLLLKTPAAKRWVSYEPALGPVDFRPWLPIETIGGVELETWLDWLVVGGESGPGARPFDVAWARSVVEQCKAAGVPVFCKQLGAQPLFYKEVGTSKGGCHVPLKLRDSKGSDPAEWPADLRVQEFPA